MFSSSSSSSCFLFLNGVVVSSPPETPPISVFLQNHPGAYTTTRTHSNASLILFWDRHLLRLAQSTSIIAQSKPGFFYHPQTAAAAATISSWDALIRPLVTQSLQSGLPIVCKERSEEEIVITTLVSGDSRPSSDGLDVYVHFGAYAPIGFVGRESGARLAVVGPGREIANAKFSEWVRVRKGLEKLRPPSVTELLLSNDGDRILEGSITNFFVVCSRDVNEALGDLNEPRSSFPFEVQTAPVSGGVLPGVIRQLILEVCSSLGIPLREVAPSWANRELWKEAFVTSSLRLVQHVEKVQAPSSWESLQSKTWKEVSWVEKQFEGPGPITTEIQKELTQRACAEGYPLNSFL
ncbi:D-aminoacid aminotransferase-like PLP-dependent enzymes superfamily protein, putative isoform 2 [Cinnamomum micranthum f. kanehirae]|uniref:D-aminoacid aminotransferase-like PLP-dependent enzymes superfamily protein, putative isoform 2 n=1 Tax=Cinnamomum micranthum f. kanehirae TaxID=337451 RepID=A0A3S3P815_9MAGN|nr:D-aminoacid aminotransferase-like PLP-dependent enzymes superfamily protein, putative isoform 2 [Cinnamomum micranthum f. kanehirae]